MLLDATLAALEARGAPRVVLSTAERNATAQRLFARAGFRRTMIEMTRELDVRENVLPQRLSNGPTTMRSKSASRK
jgi:ribosomal protein S18 acetylase RimI-like enzyme